MTHFVICLFEHAHVLQSQTRLVAHYHCVVCSVTIARKTDMISHLKRHINKGETEASYSGASDASFEEPGKRTHAVSLCVAFRFESKLSIVLLSISFSARSGI